MEWYGSSFRGYKWPNLEVTEVKQTRERITMIVMVLVARVSFFAKPGCNISIYISLFCVSYIITAKFISLSYSGWWTIGGCLLFARRSCFRPLSSFASIRLSLVSKVMVAHSWASAMRLCAFTCALTCTLNMNLLLFGSHLFVWFIG